MKNHNPDISSEISFSKWHGLGNHFVIACIAQGADLAAFSEERIKNICAPHFGVGADGLLLIDQSTAESNTIVHMFNPDGSPMGMCGNGIRCVFKHFSRYVAPITQKIFLVEGKEIHTSFHAGDVSVLMDPVSNVRDVSLNIDEETFEGVFLHIPNPHFVVEVKTLPSSQQLAAWGMALEHNDAFPHRANIEFVKVVTPQKFEVIVWERGAGATLACGTGACASAYALFLRKRVEERVTASLPGGNLHLDIQKNAVVKMTGPAQEVFKGVYTWS